VVQVTGAQFPSHHLSHSRPIGSHPIPSCQKKNKKNKIPRRKEKIASSAGTKRWTRLVVGGVGTTSGARVGLVADRPGAVEVRVDAWVELVQQVTLVRAGGVGRGAGLRRRRVVAVVAVRVDAGIELVGHLGAVRAVVGRVGARDAGDCASTVGERGVRAMGAVAETARRSVASVQMHGSIVVRAGGSRMRSQARGARVTQMRGARAGSVARAIGSGGAGGAVITARADARVQLVGGRGRVGAGSGGARDASAGGVSAVDAVSASNTSSTVVAVRVDGRVELLGDVGAVRPVVGRLGADRVGVADSGVAGGGGRVSVVGVVDVVDVAGEASASRAGGVGSVVVTALVRVDTRIKLIGDVARVGANVRRAGRVRGTAARAASVTVRVDAGIELVGDVRRMRAGGGLAGIGRAGGGGGGVRVTGVVGAGAATEVVRGITVRVDAGIEFVGGVALMGTSGGVGGGGDGMGGIGGIGGIGGSGVVVGGGVSAKGSLDFVDEVRHVGEAVRICDCCGRCLVFGVWLWWWVRLGDGGGNGMLLRPRGQLLPALLHDPRATEGIAGAAVADDIIE